MREGSYTYEVRVACPASDAVSLLSDLTRQAELHPLIIGIREVPTVADALRSYDITDRLVIGPARFRITYQADVLAVSETEVLTVARQRPRTTVRNHARIEQVGDETVIAVEVTLRAPTLLFPYALREGRKAHLVLAERIREVLLRVQP